jgi:ABC-type phosphate/phosphonate transport system permease subunit
MSSVLALGFISSMPASGMLVLFIVMFAGWVLARVCGFLLGFFARMDQMNTWLLAWCDRIASRSFSMLRKNYKMLLFMGLLRRCGVFDLGSPFDVLDELIWVLYAISSEMDHD